LRRALGETIAALAQLARPHAQASTLLEDRRLFERALEHSEAGLSPRRALDRVARETARIAELSGDTLLRARAVDVEGLCDRAAARLAKAGPPDWRPGTILVTHRLSSWDALELCAAGGIGVALSAPADQSPGLAIAGPKGLVACAGTAALFRWARSGSRILVDGTAGSVVINPGRAEVASYRARRGEKDTPARPG
jgi:phosphotransferase system enzyme I (PtsP)